MYQYLSEKKISKRKTKIQAIVFPYKDLKFFSFLGLFLTEKTAYAIITATNGLTNSAGWIEKPPIRIQDLDPPDSAKNCVIPKANAAAGNIINLNMPYRSNEKKRLIRYIHK